VPGRERDRDEKAGHRSIARMRYHHHGTYAALFAAGDRVEIAKQDVAAGHELYSGYSSAAVVARPLRSAPVH
jgi:hypothetical protein